MRRKLEKQITEKSPKSPSSPNSFKNSQSEINVNNNNEEFINKEGDKEITMAVKSGLKNSNIVLELAGKLDTQRFDPINLEATTKTTKKIEDQSWHRRQEL